MWHGTSGFECGAGRSSDSTFYESYLRRGLSGQPDSHCPSFFAAGIWMW